MNKKEIPIREISEIKSKKGFVKWLEYQYPATKGNLQIPQILDQFEQHIKEECAKIFATRQSLPIKYCEDLLKKDIRKHIFTSQDDDEDFCKECDEEQEKDQYADSE